MVVKDFPPQVSTYTKSPYSEISVN